MAHNPAHPTLRGIARQRGLTLVELMVALIVGLMVILAAMSVFTSSSSSSRAVDAAGQLRDDARFAADIIQRIAVQTGFEDIGFVTRTYQGTPQTYKSVNGDTDPTTMQAPIFGLSGQNPGNTSKEITASGNGYTPTGASATHGYNGTDTLVLRYQAVNKGSSISDADDSMMLCSGHTLGKGHGHDADKRTQRAVSIFYVSDDNDESEPTLYCRYANKEGDTLQGPVPLVKGVESFKVLYGVDNIEANTAADCGGNASNCATEHAQLIPDNYFTADELTVDDKPATAESQTNWRRVRTIRVGLVLRAAPGSGQTTSSEVIYPLGEKFGGKFGDYTPAAGDTRLRQNYIFTINVRNCLNQGYQAAGDPGKNAEDNIPPCDVIVPRA